MGWAMSAKLVYDNVYSETCWTFMNFRQRVPSVRKAAVVY